MEKSNRQIQIASSVIAACGVLFLGLNIFMGGKVNITLPLIFLTFGPAFIILVFAIWERWRFAPLFFIPGCLFSAFGIIFLLNVLTGDWQSWAYAWLLLLTGLGVGTLLAAKYVPLPKVVFISGLGTAAASLTLFALFGAIAGGWVIRITAPILLLLGGLGLRYLRSDILFPSNLFQPGRNEPGQIETAQARIDQAAANNRLAEPLSARELEVLKLIDQGLNNQEIADHLMVAPSTIKTHINNIYGKLGVQTRAQCIVSARNLKLV